MGEEAEEGRPPGDGSKGRRAPANRSVSADTSSHPCRGPPVQDQATPWAGRRPGLVSAPRTWPVAVAAGLSRSAGPHNRPGPLAPPPPPAETGPRARPRRVRSPRTHTLASPLAREPARLLYPKGHHSRLAAQAGLGEPRVASGTRAKTRPLERRRVGAMTSLAPDPRGD